MLCANLDKFTFGMTEVKYMWYIIDEKFVHMGLAMIEVLWDFSTPNTVTKLPKFLGISSFYGRFMLGFFFMQPSHKIE